MEILKEIKEPNFYAQIFKVPIYGAKIAFIKHFDSEGYKKAVDFLEQEVGVELLDEDKNKDGEDTFGYVMYQKTKYTGYLTLFVMNCKPDYQKDFINTLAHEHDHLMNYISEHFGLKRFEGDPNEHMAYLSGAIFEYIHALLFDQED